MILALGLDFGGINNLKLIKEKPSVFFRLCLPLSTPKISLFFTLEKFKTPALILIH